MKVAIIPARGGSKRIPKKNIKPFLGKPIIAYSIEAAIKSKLFDMVVVSTDDEDIARVSKEYGAEIPFIRPAELSDDFSGTHEVVGHAVKFLLDEGINVEVACCVYATAPLIQQNDLKEALNLFEQGDWDSVFAATEFSYPIFRSFQLDKNNGLKMFFPEHYESRSQDLPIAIHDAGQFYWANAKTWMETPKGFSESSTVIKIPSWRVQDIDTLEDWKRAEIIFQYLQTEKLIS